MMYYGVIEDFLDLICLLLNIMARDEEMPHRTMLEIASFCVAFLDRKDHPVSKTFQEHELCKANHRTSFGKLVRPNSKGGASFFSRIRFC